MNKKIPIEPGQVVKNTKVISKRLTFNLADV
jgi:hypothetical protein